MGDSCKYANVTLKSGISHKQLEKQRLVSTKTSGKIISLAITAQHTTLQIKSLT
jgi:hypothetical protein